MEHENCWSFWDCPDDVKKKCPAYKTGSGMDCYDLAKGFCPRLKTEYKHCWECPWYKIVNSDNS